MIGAELFTELFLSKAVDGTDLDDSIKSLGNVDILFFKRLALF